MAFWYSSDFFLEPSNFLDPSNFETETIMSTKLLSLLEPEPVKVDRSSFFEFIASGVGNSRGSYKRLKGDEVLGVCVSCKRKGPTRRSSITNRWSRHVTYNRSTGKRKFCGQYLPEKDLYHK